MDKSLKIYSKEINGFTVKAYSDSGVDWVVWSDESDFSLIRYPRRKFTMRHAMAEFAELAALHAHNKR